MRTKYIKFGHDSLSNEHFITPKNDNGWVKPCGGLWASEYTPDSEFKSVWEEFCIRKNFVVDRLDKFVVFELTEEARVYTIDSYLDLHRLINKYPIACTAKLTLDFESISEDYDIIKLTDKGQCETRYSNPYNLYSWDVECILVLNFNSIVILDKGEL